MYSHDIIPYIPAVPLENYFKSFFCIRSNFCFQVYVLDDNRQVRLVLAGTPVEIEKEVKSLTNSLSDITGLDIRIRMIEPHSGDNYQPA